MQIQWLGSPNFTSWRPGPPQYIVDHWTVSTGHSTEVHFLDPNAQVSAHYLVKRDGSIDQFVDEQFTAWHSGGEMYNYLGIGIEHEHFDEQDDPGIQQDWPDVQIEASAELHRTISARWNIPLIHRSDGQPGVLGHRETGYATQCPGTLPIDDILETALLRDEFEAYRQQLDTTIETMKKTYNPLYHHVHLPGEITPSVSSEALVPPVEGAKYAGSSLDLKQVLWLYPDGTVK